MIKRITLTEEHLKLIPFLYIQDDGKYDVGIDKNIMYNLGAHLLDDMAMILGLTDKAIPGTENDPDGRAYDDETEAHMLSLHNFMKENLFFIETLVHQFAVKGGLKPGTYKCKDYELLWERDGEE